MPSLTQGASAVWYTQDGSWRTRAEISAGFRDHRKALWTAALMALSIVLIHSSSRMKKVREWYQTRAAILASDERQSLASIT
jgi:hypothetical protein